jgi:hypothetical protein
VKRKVSWRRPRPELGCRAKGKKYYSTWYHALATRTYDSEVTLVLFGVRSKTIYDKSSLQVQIGDRLNTGSVLDVTVKRNTPKSIAGICTLFVCTTLTFLI